MNALILGCGYLGTLVADRWLKSGAAVAALTRSPERAAELTVRGIAPVVGNVTDAASLAGLPAADVALYAVGFDRAGGASRREVVIDGLRNALEVLANRVPRLVFISTTSVYGQSDGQTVDEATPPGPATESGAIALAAERLLSDPGTPWPAEVVILRLAGIYGPGRLLRRVEQLHNAEPVSGRGEAWLNLIHVADAATAALAASAGKVGPGPLLISDREPVARADYYGRLAELADAPPPTFDGRDTGRAIGLGKRCDSGPSWSRLGVAPAFPTYREGLPDAVRPGR